MKYKSNFSYLNVSNTINRHFDDIAQPDDHLYGLDKLNTDDSQFWALEEEKEARERAREKECRTILLENSSAPVKATDYIPQMLRHMQQNYNQSNRLLLQAGPAMNNIEKYVAPSKESVVEKAKQNAFMLDIRCGLAWHQSAGTAKVQEQSLLFLQEIPKP